MADYQFCSRCGGQVKIGTSFCPSCGAPVTPAPQAAPNTGYQQPYTDPNVQPAYNQGYAQNYNQGYAQQPYQNAGYQNPSQGYGTQTGSETPFYCPQCGNRTVIRVKSGSDSSKSNVGTAMMFGLLGLMFKSAFSKEQQQYSGSLLDLACKTCGCAFPSQEEYSKAIGKHRRQSTMGLILSIILLCCALLLICLPLRMVFPTFVAVFVKIFAVFCLFLGIIALIAALILRSKLKDEEAQFAEHGRVINGIGRPY